MQPQVWGREQGREDARSKRLGVGVRARYQLIRRALVDKLQLAVVDIPDAAGRPNKYCNVPEHTVGLEEL